MIGTTTLLAGCTVAAAMVTGSRIFGLKRMVRHSTVTDVTFSVGAVAVFAGTLTGALVAVMAGLMMAVLLSCLKSIDTALNKPRKPRKAWADRIKARWAETKNPLDDGWEPKYGWAVL